jgi:hypothetical protein
MASEEGHNTSELMLCPALQRCLIQDTRASALAERIHHLRSGNMRNKNSRATPRHCVCVSDYVSRNIVFLRHLDPELNLTDHN